MNFLKSLNLKIDKNSPEILTGMGVFGLFTTVGLTVQATVKSVRVVDSAKILDENLSKEDIFKLVWKNYLPPTASLILTTISILGANHVSSERLEGMTSLYLIAKDALENYKRKAVDIHGERKASKIEEEVVQDILNKTEITGDVVTIDNGTHLCFDSLSGRYFYHNIENIRRLENAFNQQLLVDMYLSLNDWYYELGLEGTELGRNVGFSVERGNMIIKFTSKIAPNGTPCLVLEYNYTPRYL